MRHTWKDVLYQAEVHKPEVSNEHIKIKEKKSSQNMIIYFHFMILMQILYS